MISARGGPDGPTSPDAQRSCVRRRQRFDPVAPDLVAGAIQINIFDTFAIKPGAIDAKEQHAAGTRAKGMTDVRAVAAIVNINLCFLVKGGEPIP